jgi:hypothetical protein
MSTFADAGMILGSIVDLRVVVVKGFDHKSVYEGRVDPWYVAEAAAKRQSQSSSRKALVRHTVFMPLFDPCLIDTSFLLHQIHNFPMNQ